MRLHDSFRCVTFAILVVSLCLVTAPQRVFGWSDTIAPVNQLRRNTSDRASSTKSSRTTSSRTSSGRDRVRLTAQKPKPSTPATLDSRTASTASRLTSGNRHLHPVSPASPVRQVAAEGPILETAYDDPSVLESAPEPVVSPTTEDATKEPELIENSGEIVYDSNEVIYGDGEVIYDDGEMIYGDGEVIYDGRHDGFHAHGPGYAQPGCNSCFSGRCGAPHRAWVHMDYLMWWTKGMNVPPLVTTAETLDQASLDPADESTILFGNDNIFEELRKGGRIRLGFWLDPYQRCGIEGEFLGLHDEQEYYGANTFDYNTVEQQVLARPFYDVNTSNPFYAVQEVSGDRLAGLVEVNTTTRLYSGGLRFISNRCCNSWNCDPYSNGYCGSIRRDFLFGYRFTTLDEALGIREQLNTVSNDYTTNFDLKDNFVTDTQFHGIDFGWQWEFVKYRWSFNLLTKIAMGANRQVVNISGSTHNATLNLSPPPEDVPHFDVTSQAGGLLTQPSNIGHYSRDRFSVMPELAATLGYELRPGVRVTAGYTFLYWTNVVRPGDQIDLAVNSEFLNGVDSATPSRPTFSFHESDYWAQGLNLGLDVRF